MHGDWFEEQETIKDWIRESQSHQAWATKIVTEALRRRADYIVSFALHLLIDAWPSGWMKVVVDHNRKPKPAYFEFQRALKPVRLNMRCDRWKVYGNQVLEIEVWMLNDHDVEYTNGRVRATLRDEAASDYGSYELDASCAKSGVAYAGTLAVSVPAVANRTLLRVDAEWLDEQGRTLDIEIFEFEAFPARASITPVQAPNVVRYLGRTAAAAIYTAGLEAISYHQDESFDILVISDRELYSDQEHQILKRVSEGARLIVLLDEKAIGEEVWSVAGASYSYERDKGLFYLARNPEHAVTRDFKAKDFAFWFNADCDYIDYCSEGSIVGGGELVPLLFRYHKLGFFEAQRGWKQKKPIVGEVIHGKGNIVLSCLPLHGRQGWNPVLDQLMLRLFTQEWGQET